MSIITETEIAPIIPPIKRLQRQIECCVHAYEACENCAQRYRLLQEAWQ